MAKIEMTCEAKGCESTNVKDYKRTFGEGFGGWRGEPIALCPKHAGNRKPILVNPYANVPPASDNQNN